MTTTYSQESNYKQIYLNVISDFLDEELCCICLDNIYELPKNEVNNTQMTNTVTENNITNSNENDITNANENDIILSNQDDTKNTIHKINYIVLPCCGNNIHKSCFIKWLFNKSIETNCPICRYNFEFINKMLDIDDLYNYIVSQNKINVADIRTANNILKKYYNYFKGNYVVTLKIGYENINTYDANITNNNNNLTSIQIDNQDDILVTTVERNTNRSRNRSRNDFLTRYVTEQCIFLTLCIPLIFLIIYGIRS
jgi:hypothetical protein